MFSQEVKDKAVFEFLRQDLPIESFVIDTIRI